MASPTKSPSFEGSFAALIKYLQNALKESTIVNIPDDVEKPFRSVSNPADSTLLKRFSKLFESTQQHHIYQLAPRSFCGIVFIVLHFPYSPTQDKLLHIFMNALHTYRDEKLVVNALRRCGILDVTSTQITATREAISHRLIHTLLRRLVGGGIDKRLRWAIAQFLSIAVCDNASARARLTSHVECKHLSTLLNDLEDYVSRILVSELMRDLIYHGTRPEVFWAHGVADQIPLSFPVAQTSSAQWFEDLRRFFADIDSSLAFTAESQCVLSVSKLDCDSKFNPKSISSAVAIISDELTFVIPRELQPLRVTTFPILREPSMTTAIIEDHNQKAVGISVSYRGELGIELCNGVRCAVNNLFATFGGVDDASTAQNMILHSQELATDPSEREERQQSPMQAATPDPKRSIALVNLWSPEGESLAATKTFSIAEAQGDWDTQEASPLQHKSQTLRRESPLGFTDHDEVSKMNNTSGAETASETSFLEAARDKTTFADRLQVSQTSPPHEPKKTSFNASVDDAVARHRVPRPKSKVLAGPQPSSKEGTTALTPHLLSEEVPSSPNKISTGSVGVSNISKTTQRSTELRRSGLVGTIAVTPEPPSSEPPAPLNPKYAKPSKPAPMPILMVKSKNAKKTPGGPMARLAGTQSQGKSKPSKTESQVSSGLKRKSPHSAKERSSQNVDWNQNLHDNNEFNLPEAESDDERPTKKARTGSKQPVRKTTVKRREGQNVKNSKAPKTTESKTCRTTDKMQSRPATATAASTRQRRAPKSAKYAEDPTSDDENEHDIPQLPGRTTKSSSSPIKPNQQQSLADLKAPKKSGAQRRLDSQDSAAIKRATENKERTSHENNTEIAAPAEKAGGAVHDSPSNETAQKPRGSRQGRLLTPALKWSDRDTPVVPQQLKHAKSTPNNHQGNLDEEEAQDSYPIDKDYRDTAVAAAKTSFGTQLVDVMTANDSKKENVAPPPQTPFGSKKQFVENVNAAKSGSPKKISVPQVPKSPEAVPPRQNSKVGDTIGEPKDVECHPSAPVLTSTSMLDITQLQHDYAQLKGKTSGHADGAPPAQDEPDIGPLEDAEYHLGAPDAPQGINDRTLHDNEALTHSNQCQGPVTPNNPRRDPEDQSIRPSPTKAKHEKARHRSLVKKSPGELQKSMPKVSKGNDVEIQTEGKEKHAKRATDERFEAIEARTDISTPNTIGKGLRAGKTAAPGKPTKSSVPQRPPTSPAPSDGFGKGRASAGDSDEKLATKSQLKAPRQSKGNTLRTLLSEKESKKPSVVHFSPQGAANQGVPSASRRSDTSSPVAPPPFSTEHRKSKQQESGYQQTSPPTHIPVAASNKLISISDDEGIIVEPDIDPAPAASPAIPEARKGESNDDGGVIPQQLLAHHPVSAAEHTSPEAKADSVIRQNTLNVPPADNSSMSELTDEEEVSEYEEESGSVDEAVDVDESYVDEMARDEASHSGIGSPAAVAHSNNAALSQAKSSKMSTKSAPSTQRHSLGLNPIVTKIFPKSEDKIKTEKFRQTQYPGNNKGKFNANPALPIDELQSAIRSDVETATGSDMILMPPPKITKRQSEIRTDKMKATSLTLPRQSPSVWAVDAPRNPLAQLRMSAEIAPAIEHSADTASGQPATRAAAVPTRVKRRLESNDVSDPAHSTGTPVPFNTWLKKIVAQTEAGETDAEHREKNRSYLSESTADTTLVNGNSNSRFMSQRPNRLASRHERELTESTDEPSSPSSHGAQLRQKHLGEDDKIWNTVACSLHGGLLEDVMQIANTVLFRLGEEEEAIRAKASEFVRGGSTVLDELTESWNNRLSHENHKLRQNLKVAWSTFSEAKRDLGKTTKGEIKVWETVLQFNEVEKKIVSRSMDLLGQLEALNGGLDA